MEAGGQEQQWWGLNCEQAGLPPPRPSAFQPCLPLCLLSLPHRTSSLQGFVLVSEHSEGFVKSSPPATRTWLPSGLLQCLISAPPPPHHGACPRDYSRCGMGHFNSTILPALTLGPLPDNAKVPTNIKVPNFHGGVGEGKKNNNFFFLYPSQVHGSAY